MWKDAATVLATLLSEDRCILEEISAECSLKWPCPQCRSSKKRSTPVNRSLHLLICMLKIEVHLLVQPRCNLCSKFTKVVASTLRGCYCASPPIRTDDFTEDFASTSNGQSSGEEYRGRKTVWRRRITLVLRPAWIKSLLRCKSNK